MCTDKSNYKTLQRVSAMPGRSNGVNCCYTAMCRFRSSYAKLCPSSFSLLPTGFEISHLILFSGNALDLDLPVDLSSVSDFPLTGFRYVNVIQYHTLAVA